ncbi:MAG TPA: DUF4124 domain-containing protein [Thermomonas sp.]|nr:DUF4124 domain-containing protein [Thermomonas sp.]
MRSTLALGLCLLPLGGVALAQSQPGSATVTVYRCTDAGGKQSLRDTPCPAGQKQQAREMQRPKDAPKPAAVPMPPKPVLPPAPAPVPVQQTETVYRAPPRPMYECTTPDGDVYTSEDSIGNPRWVPLWTLGYYPMGRPSRPAAAVSTPPPAQPAGPMRPRVDGAHWPMPGGGGTWIRDECAMLPPGETCARLRDRRSAIGTRFFNAQEKERDVLRREERAIIARLDNDCGGR